MVLTEVNVPANITEPLVLLATGAFGELYFSGQVVRWKMDTLQDPIIDVQVIREAIAAIHKITLNAKTPLVLDLSHDSGVMFTPTARAALLGQDFVRSRTAIGIVVNAVTRKTIFMHLVSYNKNNLPLKSFESEQEALKWLTTFIPN